MRIKVTLELLVLESWKINKFLIFENGRFKILDEVVEGSGKLSTTTLKTFHFRDYKFPGFSGRLQKAKSKETDASSYLFPIKLIAIVGKFFFNDVLTNNFVELYIRFSRFWRYSEAKEKQRIFHRLVKLANVKFECAGIYRRKARVLCVSYLWRFLNPRKLKC